MKEPASSCRPDRNTRVPDSMSGHRDQCEVVQPGNWIAAGKAQERFALPRICFYTHVEREMMIAVPELRRDRRACTGNRVLCGRDMHQCVWEVACAADVVVVQMRAHDMSNVVGAVPDSLQLGQCGFVLLQCRPQGQRGFSQSSGRRNVRTPNSGVDHHKAIIGFAHHYVGHQAEPERAAIEMMDSLHTDHDVPHFG